MEVSLPLISCSDPHQPMTVSLDFPIEFPSSKYCVKEGGNGIVCAHDHVKAVLFEAINDSFTIVGVFFFRVSGSQHTFSLATFQGVFDFKATASPVAPSPSADAHIILSTKHLINQVEFFDDALLIGTIGGSLGIVLFRESKSLKGCFVDQSMGHGHLHRWSFDRESNLCAVASLNGITVFAYQQGHLEDETDYTADIEVDNISSILVFKQHNGSYVSLLIHYNTSQDLTLLTLRTADRSILSYESITLGCQPPNSFCFSASEPQSFVGGTHSAHIVATLFPNSIHFSTIRETEFERHTTVVNELNVPFEFGHWDKRCSQLSTPNGTVEDSTSCFAVLRCDFVCILYNVKESGGMIEEVHLTHQIILPFSGFCFSPLQGLSGILSVACCDLVCSSAESDRSVQVQRSFNGIFLPLQGVGFVEDPLQLLLLEVVPMMKDFALVYLLKSGDCFSATYGIRGVKRIAFEENPYEVTSVLYFVKGEETISALGFNDGMVKLFTEGKLCAVVRASHCGPIDKLITLQNFYADYVDSVFISISSFMGTICLHSIETGEITQTLVSPSRPLTSCYLDRSSEYLFAFSRLAGHLWHLPSCSLERTFMITEECGFNSNLGDLLTKTWTSSMRIKTLHFLGRRYCSVYIDIDKLIMDLQRADNLLSNFFSVTSLLLNCCDVPSEISPLLTDNKLSDVLEDISLKISTERNVSVFLGAMRLLCALLDSTKDGRTACEASKMSTYLHKNFFAKCSGKSGLPLECLICDYFCTFFTDPQIISAAVRHGFQTMVRDLAPECILDLSRALLSDKMLTYQGLHREETCRKTFPGGKMYVLVSTLLVESGIQLDPKITLELQQHLITPVVEPLKQWLGSSKLEPISFDSSIALLAFSEGFPIFTKASNSSNIMYKLFEYAFGGSCEESRHVCMQAVLRIISHNIVKFIEIHCAEFSTKYPRWDAALIKLFSLYAINFPSKAFYACDCLLDFSIKLVSKCSVSDEKDAAMAALIRLVRALAALLPNVSFHISSKRVAVGTSEGVVNIYSLKSEGAVTSFKAHSEPIVSLAFNSNKTDYELATVSQNMKCVKVWKFQAQSISLVSLFSSPIKKVKLLVVVELPDVPAFVATELLIVRFCRIQWLPPQFIQFTSPWHGKVQVTIIENGAEATAMKLKESEQLPLLARIVNHILTPGSSLTPFMWIAFNVIMCGLFLVWLLFVFEMPTCIHVWVFGFLGLGLTLSTNWFMKIVFSNCMDFSAQQASDNEGVAAEKKRD